MRRASRALAASFLVLLTCSSLVLAQPSHTSYQGELLRDGTPWSGDASFKFVIVSGGASLWSNDGSSVSGNEPSTWVVIAVNDGLFSVLLGDEPMQPIDPVSLLDVSDAALRIWVDTGSGFEQLSDQILSGAPFAMRAAVADTAIAGAGSTLWQENGDDIYRLQGRVGIGTDIPWAMLTIAGDAVGSYGFAGLKLSAVADGGWATSYAIVQAGNVAGVSAHNLALNPDGGRVGVGTTAPAYTLEVQGWIATSDGVRFADGTTQTTAAAGTGDDFWSDLGSADIGYSGDVFIGGGSTDSDAASEALVIRAQSDSWYVGVRNEPSVGDSDFFISRLGSEDGTLHINRSNGNVGIGTTSPQQKLHVDGVVRADILEIVGGADIAEPFDFAGAIEAGPGTVVAIDRSSPGKLRVCDRPYDKRVAGVVSGAGGVTPGLTLQQQGTDASGAHPVALAGRVYCLCDASKAPIEAGDLLTTSSRPGHAMKVTDHARAHGAIIGKAMSGLVEGTGLVLVLVSMQ